MLKKVLVLFFILTSILHIMRYIFFLEIMSFGTFMVQFIWIILTSVAIAFSTFMVARMTRFIYNEPFKEIQITSIWFIVVILTIIGLFLYVYTIIEKDTNAWVFTSSFMPIFGMILEQSTLENSLEDEKV